jgi:hypothetical protein
MMATVKTGGSLLIFRKRVLRPSWGQFADISEESTPSIRSVNITNKSRTATRRHISLEGFLLPLKMEAEHLLESQRTSAELC